MTRNGKIARLPRQVRRELNLRLDDGAQGKQLVAWLNKLPEVQEMLRRDFAARPITEQNLSEWKQGGYEDWRRHQEDRAFVESLLEHAETLEEHCGEASLSDRLASLTALLMAKLLQKSLAGDLESPTQRSEVMAQVRTLAELRRSDQKQQRLLMEQQRHEEKRRQWEREAVEEEDRKRRQLSLQNSLRETFFPGSSGHGPSDDGPPRIQTIIRDYHEATARMPGNPTESNRIRPNQTHE